MQRIKSLRKKYRQKKLKAKRSQKAYIKSLNKMLGKVAKVVQDPDT